MLARFLAREACAMQRWPIWRHLLEVPIALCITRRVPRRVPGMILVKRPSRKWLDMQ